MVGEMEWEQRIEAFKKSGMSIRAWCLAQGIPPSTFRSRLQKTSPLKFIELKPSPRRIKIYWNHISFEIDSDFDPETLSRFLQALR